MPTQSITVDVQLTGSVDFPGFDPEVHQAETRKIFETAKEIARGDQQTLDRLSGDLATISMEVERVYGLWPSVAELEVVFPNTLEDAGALEIGSKPGVTVEAEISVNGVKIFTGDVRGIEFDDEGVVTLEAFTGIKLVDHTVRLDTGEDGVPSTALVYDLLIGDPGAPLSDDEVVLGFGGVDKAPLKAGTKSTGKELDDEFKTRFKRYLDADPITPEQIRYSTSSDTDERLVRVLADVSKKQHAYTYWDSAGRLHWSEVPPIASWNPSRFITEIQAGSSDSENTVTIVEAPSISDRLGVWDTHTRSTTTAKVGRKNAPPGKTRRIHDNNVRSVREAVNQAVDDLASSDLIKESGTLTLVGDPRVSPYDEIIIKNLPPWAKLAEGAYTAQKVRHIVDPNDGYLTEIEVGESLEDLLGGYDSVIAEERAELVGEMTGHGIELLPVAADLTARTPEEGGS